MAKDHRIEQNGQRIEFTCENRRFRTDTTKGHPHGQHPTRGSVLSELLAGGQGSNEYSLWLEHVISTEDPSDECYWLMWYCDGSPTIPMSGILHRDDIVNMQRLFASFIP